MKRLLPFASVIALILLPATAFASKFAFTANSSDSFTAEHDIIMASICSRDISRRGTNELLADLLNNSTGSRGDANSLASNANASTIVDYFAGINELGPARGGLNNINLFQTNLNAVGNSGSIPTSFGAPPEFIDTQDEISPAFVAVPSVPEPMSVLLLGSGLAGLYVRRRRQKNSA